MFSVKDNTKGKMKGILINEIPHGNQYFHDNNDAGVSYGSGDAGSIWKEPDSVGNSSSPALLSSYDDASNHGTVNHHAVMKSPSGGEEYALNVQYNQLGLCDNLQRMNIGGSGQKNYSNSTQFRVDSHSPVGDVVGLNHSPSTGIGGINQDAFYGYSMGGMSSLSPGGCDVNDSMGAFSFPSQRHFSGTALYNELQIDSYIRLMKEQQEKHHRKRDVQLQIFPAVNAVDIPQQSPSDGFHNTQQHGLPSSKPYKALVEPNIIGWKPPMAEHKSREFQPIQSRASREELGAFRYEDTFIIDGKHPSCAVDRKSNRSKVNKKKLKERSQVKDPNPDFLLRREQSSNRGGGAGYGYAPLQDISSEMVMRPFYCSLADLKGYIYLISKHQLGCRFLQKVFDEGNSENTKLIFTEILPHIVELMMDPFGNYLIQKLLDFCNEDQKLQIVLRLIKRRGELAGICSNCHGTRVVQKLIQTMKSTQQISLLMAALEPNIVDLIKDTNGNHVVQRCLQCLSNDENKVIFDAATDCCVEIARHRHGCCVLNRCVTFSTGKYREKLVTSIAPYSLHLAQDGYGNYVIQHIIEFQIPYATATLLSQFEGRYAFLSTQKFSSHVIEKCLRCIEESRTRIIQELISVPQFDQLLQDRFANYVIQSALEVAKGSIRSTLIDVLRPYEVLRTSPYCKKIFSRSLFKK